MKIITACAKIIKVFSTKIIGIICAKHAWRNEMSVSFLVFLLKTCVWTFNFGNLNLSEMSNTFIFVKNCVPLCSICYNKKNVVPLFSLPLYIFIFVWKNKVSNICNHFDIVRLKTQSEKYMALKDKILKLIPVFLLKKVIISS